MKTVQLTLVEPLVEKLRDGIGPIIAGIFDTFRVWQVAKPGIPEPVGEQT
jgi:hypothetical protein